MNNDVWSVTESGGLDSVPAPRSPLLDARVMMVDDEPLMTELIQVHLEDAGYRNFVSTHDPRETVDLIRKHQPAVLLLDLMMPQMSGFDVLEAIRKDRQLRYLPVIVLTASTSSDSKLRALRLGATDFLSKPVDASELALRVRNTLAFRQYHDRMVRFDAVTGLVNANPFGRAVDEAIAHHNDEQGTLSLLVIDLPQLQQVRESLGQAAADQLARAFAQRLTRFMPQEASASPADRAPRVARLTPDRFGLLMGPQVNVEAVEADVKRVLAALSGAVKIEALDVETLPSIGIAMAPTDGRDFATLLQGAELALTRVRQQGMLTFGFASAEAGARSYERMALGFQLRGATQRGELRLHYQPKVDLSTGRIVGAEALVRWEHPQHGLLSPARFIPLAEELGIIGEIGEWVLQAACQEAASWARAGRPGLKIAVNIAMPTFVGDRFVDLVTHATQSTGLPPDLLVLELTESMLMDDAPGAIARMHELKAIGVALSIDDFGTGYSSLSYLKRFPIDELKVDRSFVADLPGGPADTAIVKTIVALGQSLGMTVTAEGVETDPQRDLLRQLGCDLYQGFVFSKPVPAADFVALLRNSDHA
jgi:diguanylate cyclase